jgi:hypothetical protein
MAARAVWLEIPASFVAMPTSCELRSMPGATTYCANDFAMPSSMGMSPYDNASWSSLPFAFVKSPKQPENPRRQRA